MKTLRRVCGVIIGVSFILDVWFGAAILFSNGFGGAALSRGSSIIGLPSFITDYLWILFPIILVVWVYASSNRDKYPTFEKVMIVLVTLIFVFPWLFSFFALKLSDQKFAADKASFEASGRTVEIGSCSYKVYPDNSWSPRGSVAGKTCNDAEGLWIRTYPEGLTY